MILICGLQTGFNAWGTDVPQTITKAAEDVRLFGIADSTPQNGEKGAYVSFNVTFDLPDEYSLECPEEYWYNFPDTKATVYKILPDGTRTAIDFLVGKRSDKSIRWDMYWKLEPGVTYQLYRGAGFIHPFEKLSAKLDESLANDVIDISFTAPTTEELPCPPLEFGRATIGRHDSEESIPFYDGCSVAHLDSNIEIGLKDLYYKFNGVNYKLSSYMDSKCQLYRITDNGDEFMSSPGIFDWTRQSADGEYDVLQLQFLGTFYQGEKYKIVIPEGCLYPMLGKLSNYFTHTSPEIVYTFYGAAKREINLVNCDIDGKAVNEINSVSWTFDGFFNLDQPQMKMIEIFDEWDYNIKTLWVRLAGAIRNVNSGTTTVVAYVRYEDADKRGEILPRPGKYTAVFPAGVLSYADGAEGTNPKFRSDFKFIDKTSLDKAVAVSENGGYVNLEIDNGSYSHFIRVDKGVQSKMQIVPDENWIVESLLENGKDRTKEVSLSGYFYTSALTEDSKLEIRLAYAGEWMVEQSSGVYGVKGTQIRVYPQNGRIVVEGTGPADEVRVYSAGGQLVRTVKPEGDTLRIALDSGVYIVTVNSHAAKIAL